MNRERFGLSVLLAIGCLWGLNEVIFGAYLRGVFQNFTGSVLTGLTFFFLAFCIAYSRKPHTLIIPLGAVTGFKMLDIYLIHAPVCPNIIFAFATETLAFIGIYKVLGSQLKEKLYGKSILGVLSTLLAVNLFPLVRYFTGIPACVLAGTGYPLSLYHAPIAISISIFTCPLGMVLGEKLSLVIEKKPALNQVQGAKVPVLAKASFPSLVVLSLIILVLFRL